MVVYCVMVGKCYFPFLGGKGSVKNGHHFPFSSDFVNSLIMHTGVFNPKMDMQKIVTLEGFGVRADPKDHFVKNATLNKR